VREWGAGRKIRTDHIGYIFDKGSEGAGEFTELLKIDQSQDARDTVARISGGDSIEYAGLQAADYLSWGIRSQFMTAGPDPDKWDMEMDDVSREILALLGAPLVYRIPKFGIYYEKSLAKLCQDAKHYSVVDAVCNPKPIQKNLPLMIGGRGERVLLKLVAK
jgi:hypothetical protein